MHEQPHEPLPGGHRTGLTGSVLQALVRQGTMYRSELLTHVQVQEGPLWDALIQLDDEGLVTVCADSVDTYVELTPAGQAHPDAGL